jgi:hypothetical protein
MDLNQVNHIQSVEMNTPGGKRTAMKRDTIYMTRYISTRFKVTSDTYKEVEFKIPTDYEVVRSDIVSIVPID